MRPVLGWLPGGPFRLGGGRFTDAARASNHASKTHERYPTRRSEILVMGGVSPRARNAIPCAGRDTTCLTASGSGTTRTELKSFDMTEPLANGWRWHGNAGVREVSSDLVAGGQNGKRLTFPLFRSKTFRQLHLDQRSTLPLVEMAIFGASEQRSYKLVAGPCPVRSRPRISALRLNHRRYHQCH